MWWFNYKINQNLDKKIRRTRNINNKNLIELHSETGFISFNCSILGTKSNSFYK